MNTHSPKNIYNIIDQIAQLNKSKITSMERFLFRLFHKPSLVCQLLQAEEPEHHKLWNGFLSSGLLKRLLQDSSSKKMKGNGIQKSSLLSRELKKDSSSFGVINVIILGALTTERLNFILLLRRINMVSSRRMRSTWELLPTNWIAKTVLCSLTQGNSSSKVIDWVQSTLVPSILIKLHFQLVTLF